MKAYKILSYLLMAAFLLIAGCRSTSVPRDAVKLGVVLPLSGKFGEYGKKVLAGMKFAQDKINLKGGVNGKQLVLVIIDNKSVGRESAKAFEKLAKMKDIVLVMGSYSTNCTLAMKPLALKYKLPLITSTATNNVVTERNGYVFRTCFRDSYQAAAMAYFAYDSRLVTKIGIMMDLDENGTYSRDLGRKFGFAFEKLGGKVVKRVGFYHGKKEFKNQVDTLTENKAKGIFAACYDSDAVELVKQARAQGYNYSLFGSDGWDERNFYENSGDKPGKCYFASLFSPDLNTPQTKAFVEEFTALKSRMPGACEAQGFDVVNIAAEAVGMTEPGKDVRGGLYRIQDYKGVVGSISISASRDAQRDLFVKTLVKGADGKYHPELVKVITPELIKRALLK
ncbi:MAG: ABC transporter substrate-binding protein [Lentisphaerae bacterium]|nr:ABC transporter substrate-binding protein [Lentisphaerota bacterium]MCP4102225.1 ABC transporter substrate-binding protein [Lentisphaerota bacterium]